MDLRRKLLELLILSIKPNPSNLAGKIVWTEECELIKANLEELQEKVQELFDDKSVTDVTRAEAKLSHYETRLNSLNILFYSNGPSKIKVKTRKIKKIEGSCHKYKRGRAGKRVN